MARVDLVEPYAIRNIRKAVRESLQMHGEEVIALRMYHPSADQATQPRCICFDDVYSASDNYGCDVCYGTTFQGGVKELSRAWAILTDMPNVEALKKRGVWQDSQRAFQMESRPTMYENDYILRVQKWSKDHRPLVFGDAYALGAMTEESLRTGNQYGQDDTDRIGQRSRIEGLAPEHVIYKVIGRLVSPDFPVPRSDGLTR